MEAEVRESRSVTSTRTPSGIHTPWSRLGNGPWPPATVAACHGGLAEAALRPAQVQSAAANRSLRRRREAVAPTLEAGGEADRQTLPVAERSCQLTLTGTVPVALRDTVTAWQAGGSKSSLPPPSLPPSSTSRACPGARRGAYTFPTLPSPPPFCLGKAFARPGGQTDSATPDRRLPPSLTRDSRLKDPQGGSPRVVRV